MDDANKAVSGAPTAGSSTNAADPIRSDAFDGVRIVEETVTKPAPPAPPTPPPEASAPQAPAFAAQMPQAPSRTPEEFAKEQETIAKILKEAKLPQRRLESANNKPPTMFDTTLGTETPSPPPPPFEEAPQGSSQPSPATNEKKGEGLAETIVSPLRTLKNDLQSVVRLKKMSLVRAVALEEEKRSHPSENERVKEEVSERRSRRSTGILFASALLVLLGAAAFFGVFLVMGERSGSQKAPPQSDILFSESSVPLPLEGNALELKRLLANARLSGSGTLGSITRIVPVVAVPGAEGITQERPATLEEFLHALDARAPDELLRALSQDFFFGLHAVDENAPLFVIPVASYERAFAGMLRWEERLSADVSLVFTPVPDQVLGAGGLPEKRRFEDVIMRNYDVRVLKDDTGTIQLYYSFPSRDLLVIAESPYSFTEILSRLRAERKL